MVFLQYFQKGQPIHARHLEVKSDDVWLQCDNLVARHIGITGVTYDVNLGITGQGIADREPGQGGIIHNQHPNFANQWLHIF